MWLVAATSVSTENIPVVTDCSGWHCCRAETDAPTISVPSHLSLPLCFDDSSPDAWAQSTNDPQLGGLPALFLNSSVAFG